MRVVNAIAIVALLLNSLLMASSYRDAIGILKLTEGRKSINMIEGEARVNKSPPSQEKRVQQKTWGMNGNVLSQICTETRAKNCSISLKMLSLLAENGKHLAMLRKQSQLQLTACTIMFFESSEKSPILCESGRIKLVNISLMSLASSFQISSLVSVPCQAYDMNCESELEVEKTSFSSFALLSTPFFCSDGLRQVKLDELNLLNISEVEYAEHLRSGLHCCRTDVKGCEFNSVSNVYYGGIVSSINSRGTSLCAFNSSFGSCLRTRNVEFEHNESMDQVVTENDLVYTFIYCEWHSPGVVDRGAAIRLNGRPILLNVSCCLFEECNVTYYYGAIYAVYIDSVKINGSNFTHCCVIDRQTEDGGGGAVGSDSNNETVISSCTFENCQSSFSRGSLFLNKRESNERDCYLSSSSFIGNSAFHMGGAITVETTFSINYILDCLFERNSANKGGAIHFVNVLPNENSTALVLYCLFVGNKAEIGSDVLMNDTANIYFTRSPFIDCFSTRKEEGRVVHVNSTENVRDEWIPVLNCIYVSPEGEDSPVLCGLSRSAACKSIGYVAQKCVSSISIQLTTGVLESEIATVSIENQVLYIIGEGVESSTLVNNLGEDYLTFFAIGGGTLSVSEMTIMQQGLDQSLGSSLFVVGDVGDPGDLERRGSEKDGMLIVSLCDVKSTGSENDGKAFGRPWFVVKRGSAELRNVNVMEGVFEGSSAMLLGSSLSQMTMSACSMRKLNRRDNGSVVIESEDGGSVEVNNCSFIDCNASNSEWGGGMRAVCLHPEGALVLKNKTTIRSCCASMESGRGGGIYVSVDGGVDGFMFEEIGFDGNKAAIGRDVYFECEDLSQSVNRTSFGFAESIEDRNNSMCGRDCTFFRSDTDLYVFLSGYFGTEIKADKTNGRDEIYCGREIACRSLEYSQTRLTGTDMRTININISTTMDGIIELEYHTISSMRQGLADVLIGGDLNEGSSCGMNVRGRALFEQIRFQLPISLGESQEALVHCCSSVSFLELVGCAFGAKEESGVPLTYCLILSLSGRVNLTRCTLSNLLVGIAPFCFGRECKVLMSGMIAHGVTIGKESLFLIPHETDEVVDASVQTFVVEHSTFEEIHTTTGTDTPALLCVDLCRELDLDNCTIKGAVSEGSKEGGGMKVRMGRGGFLRARGVSGESVSKISLCSCSETIGKGGFLWLSCEDDNHNYQLSNLLFEMNTASVGKNLFVRCSDLNETTTRDRYDLDMSLWERTGNEFVGEDINHELWNETVDMMHFLELYGSDVVSVSWTRGYDVRGCGSSLLACRTFLVGHSHCTSKGSPQKKIILENSATIGEVYDLSSFCICSMGPDKARVQFEEKIKKGEIGECVMLNTKEIEFESILFVLPSRFEGSMNTLISSKEQEGKVCLRKCAFINETSALFSFHIARIGEGVLSVVECNMGEIGFCVSPFVLGDGTASSFESLVVEKVKLSDEPLLKIVHTENGHLPWTRRNTQRGSIAMSGCIFHDVLKEGGNSAGILSSLSGMSIKIEGCEFERVISRESISGGCLNVVVGRGGCLQMNGSVTGFECECESSRSGRGGFVFIESREDEDGLSLEGLRFRDNKAHSGRDMYVMCQDLVESVSSITFAFALEIEEEKRGNSLVGRDERRFREEEDLFMLITGYFGANVIVSEKRGVDNAGCGKAVLPCCSVDWGASHLNRVGEQQVVIEEEGCVNGEVELTSVIVEAANERGCAMNVNGSVSGESVVVMITRGCTFKFVGFVLPGKFVNGYRVVVEGAGEMEVLVLLECSFRQEEMKKLEVVVISVREGGLSMEMCLIQSICSAMPLIVVPSISINREQNSRIICVRNSLFEGVEGQGNNASVMGLMLDGKIAAKVENCTVSECGGEWSNCGGGAFVTVPVEGEYVVNNTKVEKCWTERGKGGGMYLDCVSKEKKLAGFCFMDVVFKENRAMIGRDVFIRCNSISEQISEKQFQIDFREPGFERMNAVWGVEAKDGAEDVDLIPYVVVYRSEVIFVRGEMGEAGDMKTCGSRNSPCETLEYGLSHVIGTSYSQLLIDGWARVKRSGKAESVRVSSLSLEENGRVVLNESVEEEWGESGVVECWESVVVERVSIEVGSLFKWKGESILSVRSGTLSVILCEMCGALMNEAMSNSLIENKGGILHLTSSSIHSLMLSQPLIASCNQTFNDVGNVTMEKVSTSDVVCACCGCKMRWRSVVIRDISGGGVVSLSEAEFEGNDVRMERMSLEQSGIVFDWRTKIELFSLTVEAVFFEKGSMIEALEIECENFVCANSEICCLSVVLATFRNVSTNARQSSVMSLRATESNDFGVEVCNSSFSYCSSASIKGEVVGIWMMQNTKLENCIFSLDGSFEENKTKRMNFEKEKKEGLCKWNGSLVGVEKSKVEMRETTIMKSKRGGLWVSGGNVKIENGKFENNNPSIEGYPSARRNAICEGNGELNVVSVKGGDGWERNTSLWILDEGCELGGIASERGSSFFIPILEEVKNISQPNGNLELMIVGKLLLPCDLSVKMSMKNGNEEEIVRKGIEEEGFVSENEIHTFISCSEWEKVREETEVSVWIVFGKGDSPSSTESFIVKNRSESVVEGDERIVEGGKEGKSYWLLIIIVLVVVLFIVLIVSVIVTIRWRKAKNEAKDLREIVNDTVRKDPKAFEMVTMEMSPEEQWRRAEREAEKKNEERIKRRVYDSNMEHSESSEHLLSESGSTEYILGRDSDKIPQWMLEKEDEEETRKRTPSPSISSISTTDSDSSFVRTESLCLTTSSMSNLVDAMDCSSPHEKLIVDLRDSLFMLLHGLNKTKEMAIGTLQEREQTAAQILFWVANLALHSFDEMENPLQSLSNLSPHIVLFSEHMVICIVMHSDFSSDSDSSSTSSSTVVTSASDDDDDDDDSLPSSALEDDEYNRKECLRWKAPELLINKKMGATKESVVFSIGMMLWECLTLEIPFGEYEGEVAGQKIVNGERPNMEMIRGSRLERMTKAMISHSPSSRITLADVKKGLFELFPLESKMVTISDAIEIYGTKEGEYECGEAGDGNDDGDRHRQQRRSTVAETETEEDQSAEARSEEKEIRVSFFQ